MKMRRYAPSTSAVATRRGSLLLAIRGLKPAEAHGYRQLPLRGTAAEATLVGRYRLSTVIMSLFRDVNAAQSSLGVSSPKCPNFRDRRDACPTF